MPKLYLGVIDQPYTNATYMPGSKKSTATTGMVAEWLENKYHVMEHFWQIYGEGSKAVIPGLLLKSLTRAVNTLLISGKAPRQINPFGTATGEIEVLFKQMLDAKELDMLGYPGIPTKQALIGYSNRFKRRRGPVRPSFIDTGLYQASFKAWVD